MHFGTRANRGGDGFYEMFSDLIFGVMAIFVLLFIILISLLRPPPPEITPPEKVDLVIAIDVSGSMGPQIMQLKTALSELGRNFPNLIDDFRVGLVAYREASFPSGTKDAMVFDVKSLNRIAFSSLEAFLDLNVFSENGRVDPLNALALGVELFGDDIKDEGRSRILALIGDAATEYRVNKNNNFNVALSDVRSISSKFTEQSAANRVLSIYSGDKAKNPQAYQFFCEFASASERKGRLVLGSERLVWTLLEDLWKGNEDEDNSEDDYTPLVC